MSASQQDLLAKLLKSVASHEVGGVTVKRPAEIVPKGTRVIMPDGTIVNAPETTIDRSDPFLAPKHPAIDQGILAPFYGNRPDPNRTRQS